MKLAYLACAALTGCALILAGCAATPPPPAAPVTPAATGTNHVNPGATEQPVAGLLDMADQTKLDQLNPQFPVEYPVVEGQVDATQTVSTKELRYALTVPKSAAAVEEWYRRTLEGRAFMLRSEKGIENGVEIVYFRGNAVYTIDIESTGPETTSVEAKLVIE
jgi:hypothetical protein